MIEINIYSFLAVLFFQCVGAFSHWFKMKKTSRAQGTFIDYMIADYPGRSVATGAVFVVAAWMSAISGAADNINPELMWALLSKGILHAPSINGIIAAITAGYALDSMANKAQKDSVLR